MGGIVLGVGAGTFGDGYKKKCEICGGAFTTHASKRKFCSKDCERQGKNKNARDRRKRG